MKRIDRIRQIDSAGCVLVRNGAKHDWSRNLKTGVAQPVPRRREIDERLARKIVRVLTKDNDS
jgi:mRNA interferase HicA